MWTLRYQDGTLIVEGADLADLPEEFEFDDRIKAPRGPAWRYADVVLGAHRSGRPLDDQAKAFEKLPLEHLAERQARPYQREALDAWVANGRRGAVILPTGSGKTFVAELAILTTQRPALIVAPTIDLVNQWHTRMRAVFGVACGILGGGVHELGPITVSTYDSAALHLGRYGDRFGLVVWDEAHHLAAPGRIAAAECCLAPFRLALTATWERQDGREELLHSVLGGGIVYRREITELAGDYLADYETVQLIVHLGPKERARYEECRETFRDFCRSEGIGIGGPGGWQSFLRASARSKAGRAAHKCFMEYKSIAHGSEQKLELLASLLADEHGRRTLIFTHDNATAYRVSREFLVPCITHRTDIRERKAIIEAFSAGTLPVLVTSRVLNEGVDLPEAEVAVVLSGSGTVREHVQRLGRILRPGKGKQAILYELVSAGTTEEYASSRRRQHSAYQQPS
mgnify:CR=1 FL=1